MNESMEGSLETDARSPEDVLHQSKQQVQALGHKAQARVMSKAEELRGGAARRLHAFADALEDLAEGDGREELAPVARAASGFVRKTGDLVNRRSAEELLQRAKDTVRDRPGVALLGMIAVGFLGARLLKD